MLVENIAMRQLNQINIFPDIDVVPSLSNSLGIEI